MDPSFAGGDDGLPDDASLLGYSASGGGMTSSSAMLHQDPRKVMHPHQARFIQEFDDLHAESAAGGVAYRPVYGSGFGGGRSGPFRPGMQGRRSGVPTNSQGFPCVTSSSALTPAAGRGGASPSPSPSLSSHPHPSSTMLHHAAGMGRGIPAGSFAPRGPSSCGPPVAAYQPSVGAAAVPGMGGRGYPSPPPPASSSSSATSHGPYGTHLSQMNPRFDPRYGNATAPHVTVTSSYPLPGSEPALGAQLPPSATGAPPPPPPPSFPTTTNKHPQKETAPASALPLSAVEVTPQKMSAEASSNAWERWQHEWKLHADSQFQKLNDLQTATQQKIETSDAKIAQQLQHLCERQAQFERDMHMRLDKMNHQLQLVLRSFATAAGTAPSKSAINSGTATDAALLMVKLPSLGPSCAFAEFEKQQLGSSSSLLDTPSSALSAMAVTATTTPTTTVAAPASVAAGTLRTNLFLAHPCDENAEEQLATAHEEDEESWSDAMPITSR